jgi:hypothetical protein
MHHNWLDGSMAGSTAMGENEARGFVPGTRLRFTTNSF